LHYKFALHRTFFSKSPESNDDARLWRFFLNNPDAMIAFKYHETQIEDDDGGRVTTTLTNEDIAAFLS